MFYFSAAQQVVTKQQVFVVLLNGSHNSVNLKIQNFVLLNCWTFRKCQYEIDTKFKILKISFRYNR